MSDTLFFMALSLLPVLPILALFSVINTGLLSVLFVTVASSLIFAVLCNSSIVFCFTFPIIPAVIIAVRNFFGIKRKSDRFIVVNYTGANGLYTVSDGRKEHTITLLDEYENGSIIFVRSPRFD